MSDPAASDYRAKIRAVAERLLTAVPSGVVKLRSTAGVARFSSIGFELVSGFARSVDDFSQASWRMCNSSFC